MIATAAYVFISHGSEDRDGAGALSTFIEARGIRTWIAPRDVRPGRDYSEQLQLAIEQCAAFVVLVTEKANTSPYVRAETEMAFSTGKPIFPVRHGAIQPASGLAFFLNIRHWTDAFGADADQAMERLGRELDSLCGGTATAPPLAPTPPPPPAPSPPPAPAPPMPDQALLAAAIGPNADWYLERWRRMDASGTWLSWNWPAFLASIFWFAWRKLWLVLALFVGAVLLLDQITQRWPGLLAPAWLVLAAMAAGAGAAGNHLYRRQVERLVAGTAGLDRPAALARLAARGGTSVPGLATSLAIFLVLVFAVTLAQINQPPRPGPGPGPDPPPGPAAFGPADLVGQWTDEPDCANAAAFNADGSFTAAGGATGNWTLAGDRLILSGTSTMTLRLVPVDADNIVLIKPDGTEMRTRRC